MAKFKKYYYYYYYLNINIFIDFEDNLIIKKWLNLRNSYLKGKINRIIILIYKKFYLKSKTNVDQGNMSRQEWGKFHLHLKILLIIKG